MTGPSHHLKVDLAEPRNWHNREIIFMGDVAYLTVDGRQVYGVTSLEMEEVSAGNFGRLHIGFFDHIEGDLKDGPDDDDEAGEFADDIIPTIAYSSRRRVKRITIAVEMEPEVTSDAAG